MPSNISSQKPKAPRKPRVSNGYEEVLLKTNRENGRRLFKVVRISTQALQGYLVRLPDKVSATGKVIEGKQNYWGPARDKEGKRENHDFCYRAALERYKG